MDIEVAAEPIDLTQTPPAAEQDDSLAAHEAAFGEAKPARPETPAPDVAEPKGRHRAQSQRARPDDVAEIAAQTKRLREAEEAIAIERKDGESDRVYQLRRRAEIAELAKSYKTQPAATTQQIEQSKVPRVVQAPPPATNKPTWAQFEEQIGSKYQTWAEAQDAYADARDDWRQAEWVRQRATAESEAASRAAIEADTKAIHAHNTRMQTALQDQGYQVATADVRERQLPQALLKAIVTAENSPQVVLGLAHDPDFLDELIVHAHGKSVDDDVFVATLQRRLMKRTQAGTTGSVTSAPVTKITPRPPNPVRTGPIASGDDLPGDDSSLAEHEKAFGRRRRR